MLDRQKMSGFEGTLTPPRFMGREHLQNLDVNRGHEPIHWWGETPSSPDILIGKNVRVRRLPARRLQLGESLTPPRFMERIAVPKGRLNHSPAILCPEQTVGADVGHWGFGRPCGTYAIAHANPAVNCRAILESPSGRRRQPIGPNSSPRIVIGVGVIQKDR